MIIPFCHAISKKWPKEEPVFFEAAFEKPGEEPIKGLISIEFRKKHFYTGYTFFCRIKFSGGKFKGQEIFSAHGFWDHENKEEIRLQYDTIFIDGYSRYHPSPAAILDSIKRKAEQLSSEIKLKYKASEQGTDRPSFYSKSLFNKSEAI